MGLFDSIKRAAIEKAEGIQLQTQGATEKAYTMSMDQLLHYFTKKPSDSLFVQNAYANVLKKRLKELPDDMLERNFLHFKKVKPVISNILGTELVERGKYKQVDSGVFIKK